MRIAGLFAGMIAAGLAAGAHAASVTLETNPSSGQVEPGDLVTASVVTSTDFPSFTGVNLDLAYDADILSYRHEETSFSDVFDERMTVPQEEPADAAGPTVIHNISGSAFFNSGEGAARLVTLAFGAVRPGVTEVSVTGTGDRLVVNLGDVVFAGKEPLSAGIEVVPLPAPILLLGSALAGLGYVRYRARTA